MMLRSRFVQETVSFSPIIRIFCSEPLEIPNAGMRGSLEDSAPRPIVTADVRITTMSNFAPAACARCAFCAKVQFPCCTSKAQRRHLGSFVHPKRSLGRTT